MLPSRLESNPDAFGPKYESLGDALKSFNQKMVLGEDEIPGKKSDICAHCTNFMGKARACLKCCKLNICDHVLKCSGKF